MHAIICKIHKSIYMTPSQYRTCDIISPQDFQEIPVGSVKYSMGQLKFSADPAIEPLSD